MALAGRAAGVAAALIYESAESRAGARQLDNQRIDGRLLGMPPIYLLQAREESHHDLREPAAERGVIVSLRRLDVAHRNVTLFERAAQGTGV